VAQEVSVEKDFDISEKYCTFVRDFKIGTRKRMNANDDILTKKRPLLGMTEEELRQACKELGMPAFTGSQIAKWVYNANGNGNANGNANGNQDKGLGTKDNEGKVNVNVSVPVDIASWSNISKKNRELLAEHYEVGLMAPLDSQKSKDGTIKYLFPVSNGKMVETVFIPEKDRATLCVSCQVGCKMNCLFCQTGKQGFEGQLTAGDILNQIYSLPERERLTNIVFMGQGEPMDNLDNVLKATEILTAKWGMAWSPRRITVSSVGVKDKLKRFIEESECHLAISLHSPIHEQRAQLMPAEKGMSIEEVVGLLKNYDFSGQRRLSFEYIVFDGLNDTPTHAREIVRLLSGLDCRVNLIRFHSIPDVPLKTSDEKKMENLRDYLTKHGIFTTIRASRGQDIFAACGMLYSKKGTPTLS
jgi:23S rRNA (adenine2503-C2)-methyltransferase